jgi:hypothetical protein
MGVSRIAVVVLVEKDAGVTCSPPIDFCSVLLGDLASSFFDYEEQNTIAQSSDPELLEMSNMVPRPTVRRNRNGGISGV